jgi:hypothetical protein
MKHLFLFKIASEMGVCADTEADAWIQAFQDCPKSHFLERVTRVVPFTEAEPDVLVPKPLIQ